MSEYCSFIYISADIDQFYLIRCIRITCVSNENYLAEIYNMWWITSLIVNHTFINTRKFKFLRNLNFFSNTRPGIGKYAGGDYSILKILIEMNISFEYGLFCNKNDLLNFLQNNTNRKYEIYYVCVLSYYVQMG